MTPQTRNALWPPINTPAEAKQVAKQGFWAAVCVATLTAIFALVAIALGESILDMPIDAWSFVDVGIFIAIALGIRKLSRIAAILGLIFYVLGQIYMWTTVGFQPNGIPIMAILVMAFINGIRGTFAYHRLRQNK
ncbi:MAG: hypothetical protein F6K04_10725 [Leptolyngbya sp. SIO4C5]|nr:hypothetical protein [Leptolyngbya sp. SIO4C5]